MAQYIIKCRVVLEGADMVVEADSPDEAMRKAKTGDWEDIECDCASVAECDVTGKPRED